MLTETAASQRWQTLPIGLTDAYDDFILSRQAMQCSPATLEFYKYTAGKFLAIMKQQGIVSADQIQARHVREYLAKLMERGKSDNTVHDNARAIRTLFRFWYAENYISSPVDFAMPRVARKRLPCLTADELSRVITACQNPRDRAITLFMADSGLRRAEVIALDWSDIDMASGLVTVRRGKGGKARSAVIGVQTRRTLLSYRRTLEHTEDHAPVFQARGGTRFTGSGLVLVFRRMSKRTGIYVTPHALRRTFVILALRAEMDVLHLQAMLGHSSLEMVQHYAQMVDDDLLQAHKAHSPIDNLSRLR